MTSEKALGTVAVVAIFGGVGYVLLKMMGKEPDIPVIPEVQIVEVMREKLVYFQDKGDEFRENLEDITTKMDVAKEKFETGLVNVGNQLTEAVNTINNIREMTGQEPSTIDLTKLQQDIARVTGTTIDSVKTVVTEPVKTVTERYDDMKSSLGSLQEKLTMTLNTEPIIEKIVEPITVVPQYLRDRYMIR